MSSTSVRMSSDDHLDSPAAVIASRSSIVMSPPPLLVTVPTPMTLSSVEDAPDSWATGDLDVEMVDEPIASQSSSPNNQDSFHTESDAYDLFCEYYGSFPSYDLANEMSLDDLCDDPTLQCKESISKSIPVSSHWNNYFVPFLNATTWQLISWFYNSSPQKSL